MKTACWILALALVALPRVAAASPQSDLDSAARKARTAYLIVTEPGAAGVEEARKMVASAAARVPGAMIVELNRAEASNADLVARFRLAGAPLPVILVVAPNGAVAGGMVAGQASVDKLVNLAPSPRKAEVLQAVQSGKAVFVTAARKSMANRAGAQAACAQACGTVGPGAYSILVDMDDPAEAQFLAELKVSPVATEPVTVVINAQGQITGTFVGAAASADLVSAAARQAGGCAPGACGPGSGKSCGPTGSK